MEMQDKNDNRIQKYAERDGEIKKQIKELQKRFGTQAKHNGTHQVDIVAELPNKLQAHIQNTTGRQRDMSNRLLALEEHLRS